MKKMLQNIKVKNMHRRVSKSKINFRVCAYLALQKYFYKTKKIIKSICHFADLKAECKIVLILDLNYADFFKTKQIIILITCYIFKAGNLDKDNISPTLR